VTTTKRLFSEISLEKAVFILGDVVDEKRYHTFNFEFNLSYTP
jgi:hypothetical protein